MSLAFQSALFFCLSIALELKNFRILFLIGFFINFFTSLSTLLLFKFKIEHLKTLGLRKLTLLTKLGNKTAVQLTTILLIYISYQISFTLGYRIGSLGIAFFCCVFCLREKEALMSSSKDSYIQKTEVENSIIFGALLDLSSSLKKIPSQTLLAYLTLNSGNLCLSGWLLIYLKELTQNPQIIIEQKFLSILGYFLGFILTYFLQKKIHLMKILALSSTCYTVILFSLTQMKSETVIYLQLLFFLKDFLNASILSLKYSWLTSLCKDKATTLKIYSSLISIHNLLYFFLSSFSGWIMGYYGWPALWSIALFFNCCGLCALAYEQSKLMIKKSVKKTKDRVSLPLELPSSR